MTKHIGRKLLRSTRYGFMKRNHTVEFFDCKTALQPSPGADKFCRRHGLRHGKAPPSRPFETIPFLHRGRPAGVRPQCRQATVPPRKAVMPFQVHSTPHLSIHPDPASGRASLLCVEPVSNVQVHDRMEPIGRSERAPLRPLPQPMSAVSQTSPKRFFQAVILELRARRRKSVHTPRTLSSIEFRPRYARRKRSMSLRLKSHSSARD